MIVQTNQCSLNVLLQVVVWYMYMYHHSCPFDYRPSPNIASRKCAARGPAVHAIQYICHTRSCLASDLGLVYRTAARLNLSLLRFVKTATFRNTARHLRGRAEQLIYSSSHQLALRPSRLLYSQLSPAVLLYMCRTTQRMHCCSHFAQINISNNMHWLCRHNINADLQMCAFQGQTHISASRTNTQIYIAHKHTGACTMCT
eukprot:scpid100894/ scgid25799/ 